VLRAAWTNIIRQVEQAAIDDAPVADATIREEEKNVEIYEP